MIDAYVPVFEKGWDTTRDDRIGTPAARSASCRRPRRCRRGTRAYPIWAELSEREQRLFVRFQAAFAAMLTHTDREIGRLIDVLDRTGSLDNTMFVVMSDNGASQEGSQAGTLHQGRYFERAPMTLDQSIDLDRRDRRDAVVQQLSARLGDGRQHAVQVLQTEHPRRRRPRPARGPLAGGAAVRVVRYAAAPVPSRHRSGADRARSRRDRPARRR